jgi:TonB-dependent SusC/RagA subfamily outer membrane receptor
MQKRNLNSLFVVILFTIASLPFYAKAQNYATTKEKVYMQINHVFFKPGDVVYFKLYVVKAEDQTPTTVSNVVYAELLSPSGTVVQKSNFAVQDGYAEGSFEFSEQAVGGIYKIRVYTSWMQNENESHFFIKEITLQKVLAPRVMMKLDFPEKGYGPGDEVKANFSMRNLADQPIRNYEGKFTVSIGGEVISSSKFKTNHEGKEVIQFSLPANLSVNDGLLNVTVQYDSYTEAISRSIPIVLNKIDLQFMPEGGTLVEGIPGYIAFKALNENGKASDIKGEIRDSKGNKVTNFESYHFGMGKFLFTPRAGETYKALITSPSGIKQLYDLPFASANGISLQISKEKKIIYVKLMATERIDVRLQATSRNVTYYADTIRLRKGENDVELDELDFPEGIAQFTVFTLNEMPLSERLVFMNEDEHLQVNITTDKQKYLPREKVKLTIKTMDEDGKPVPSNFSLSVVDDKLWTFADDKQDHILSWLLLSSELKGKIEEPQFYFKKEEPKAVPALDLLMLTQGYRYFDYIDYVVKEGTLKFLPDQENIVSGQVLDANNHPVKANMFIINPVKGGKAMQISTDENGLFLFFFSNLQAYSNYYLFAQSLNKKEKVRISVLQNGLGYNPSKSKEFKQLVSKPVDFALQPFVANKPAERKMVAPFKMMEDRLILNDKNVMVGTEVVVTALGQRRMAKELGYSVQRITANELAAAANLENGLNGKVAGLQIVQNGENLDDTKITLRGIRSLTGSYQPLLVLNGIPMELMNLGSLNPNDIESVTVLKDATATSLFGSKAANGALVIETKKFRREKLQFKFANKYYYASTPIYTTGNVFAYAKKFYAPKYETTKTEERNDFRETIYWNPVVQTDKNGSATVEFYNSDASTTFRAIAEGIAYNGELGRGEATYAVQNSFQVDAKIPPYLTVGDQALIPLVIKNNSLSTQTFNLNIAAPDGFKIGNYILNFKIKPDSSTQMLIPVEAMIAAVGNIKFYITGSIGDETVSLPIQANEKGFPVKLTFSGNQSTQHDFNIGKMIPGSMTVKLKLFKNLEGQLLDGIESMLHEPYGCFEQTSSTTYPNVFILKYLRESGRSNPEIEKKALGYIENGYKKLAGFETAQDGFEWFGKTPPHEALTAYGLLEFTDMQEFIAVDKKMMERTKKFLLDRRDGKGYFKLSHNGYDQFRSVPDKIANIYIVYALTQAGIGKEIQKEYETALQQAIISKDGYQIAMMAIAAATMKDVAGYKKLMDEMEKQTSNENLNAETSVVNSREASLRVETRALYAMALMKAASPDMGKAANQISKILAEKSYYGYGSTQATVLALQSIVEYSKLTGRISEDAPVQFTINNKSVSENTLLSENILEGNNSFAVNYKQKDKAVPYSLEISYNTFTPPNSEKAELELHTNIKTNQTKVGETVRMEIAVTNTKAMLQPMAIAKIGIPAGLSVQPWQLKEIMEKNQAAYYEIFDNYLVFYWMGFAPNETKTINLDLKAEVPGAYKGKASNVYLYYMPEFKNWNEGAEVNVKQ